MYEISPKLIIFIANFEEIRNFIHYSSVYILTF